MRNQCVHAGKIVLHLKSVVLHHSATRFRDSQGGIKTLDDEYFGKLSCLKSILLITKRAQLAFFLMKVLVKLFVKWFNPIVTIS